MEGYLINTMTDGSIINEGSIHIDSSEAVIQSPDNTSSVSIDSTKTLVTLAIIGSSAALLWNAVNLITSVVKKRKS